MTQSTDWTHICPKHRYDICVSNLSVLKLLGINFSYPSWGCWREDRNRNELDLTRPVDQQTHFADSITDTGQHQSCGPLLASLGPIASNPRRRDLSPACALCTWAPATVARLRIGSMCPADLRQGQIREWMFIPSRRPLTGNIRFCHLVR